MSLADLQRHATKLCLGPAPSEGALAELGDARIWRLYREMVRNRLRGELRFALRRSHAAFGDALFDRLVDHVLEHAPPASRPFHGIVHDFARSAQPLVREIAAREPEAAVPAFAADLIAYEAALWAVSDLDDRIEATPAELSFDAPPVLTPARRLLALQHAVNEAAQASGGYRAGEIFLCVYRRPEDTTARTFVLNATMYALMLELDSGAVTLTEAVQRVARARKLQVDAAFIDGLCTVLADFSERGLLLGSKG
jgi:hypothetical protein